jgi:hypothetical protein
VTQGSQTGDSRDIQRRALVGAMKGLGLKHGSLVKAVRRLCETGHAQLVLEATAEVLLSNAILSGAVPPNAGVMSKDLALAVEAALLPVARDHLQDGTPLWKYATADHLHAEMCKQWVQGFAPPIPETHSIRGTLSDPEVQDRLTVVTLVLRELILEASDTYDSTGAFESDEVRFSASERLEKLCRDAAVTMFRAFEHPNTTNHELIHMIRGKKVTPDAG